MREVGGSIEVVEEEEDDDDERRRGRQGLKNTLKKRGSTYTAVCLEGRAGSLLPTADTLRHGTRG